MARRNPQYDDEITMRIECPNYDECGFDDNVTMTENSGIAYFVCPRCECDDEINLHEYYEWLHADAVMEARRDSDW